MKNDLSWRCVQEAATESELQAFQATTWDCPPPSVLIVPAHKNQGNRSLLSSAEQLIINQCSSGEKSTFTFFLFKYWYNLRFLSIVMCEEPVRIQFALHPGIGTELP